jgi:hypothetical protein
LEVKGGAESGASRSLAVAEEELAGVPLLFSELLLTFIFRGFSFLRGLDVLKTEAEELVDEESNLRARDDDRCPEDEDRLCTLKIEGRVAGLLVGEESRAWS